MNALIGFISSFVIVLIAGAFVLTRFGPPKDARRQEVKKARAAEIRAKIVLRTVRDTLAQVHEVTLDPVGADMRERVLRIINQYEEKELEIIQGD